MPTDQTRQTAEPWPVRSVRTETVTVTVALFGKGSNEDLVREVEQWWLPDGRCIRIDPVTGASVIGAVGGPS